MTSYTPISALPVVVGSLDPASYLEVSVPDSTSSTGYTSYRATPNQIASLGSGFVPTSRVVDTIPAEGLTGGGALSSDLTLRFSAVSMPTSSAMVIADTFVINNSGTNTPYQVTFPNAMKALTGLTALSIPDLLADYLVINHAADGLSYKVNPSSLGLAAGNMPAGGTTGQSLIKRSNTDYDTEWATGSFTDQAANNVFAGPTSGPNAQPDFRALVAADLPDPTTSAKGGVEAYNAVSHQFLTSISTSGAPASAQPAFTDISGTAIVSQGGTGATTLTNHGILLGQGTSAIAAIAVMTDGQLLIGQSAADPSPTTVSGDITISALGVTTIGANKVTNGMIRQSAALSVIGNSTAALADVDDIAGTADQILRVAAAGASMGFGSIDLSKSAAVGTSVLPVGNGGTNIASYTIGDILYASGSTALSKLADVATGNALISGGVATAPSWGKIGLTTHVSGTLAIANGGTGQTTASAAFDALSPVTTRGDLIYRNATTNARLAIGSANTVLRTNGTDPSWGSVVLTTDVSGILPVANGGTGASAFSVNGILYGNNTSAVQVTAAGTTGQVLAGVTGTSPTFEDISTVIDSIGSTQGQILYRDASSWSVLAVGTSGQVLATQGAAANPHWIDVAGTGTVTSVAVSGGTTGLTTSGGPITTAGTITIAGTLATANGGTNLTSYTQGDMLYASSSSVISKLAKDTNATRYLSNTGVTNNPAWAQVDLSNGVTGDLPFANITQISTSTLLGRSTAGTGDIEVLTATQATALLDDMVGDSGSGGTKGLVPAPASGDSTNFLKGDGTWAIASTRETLTANRTYYVRSDGSDSNNGLANTAGGAFLTLSHAVSVVAGLDLSIYVVTIQIGLAGTYAGCTISAPFVGGTGSHVLISGDIVSPGSYVLSSQIAVTGGGTIYVQGVDFTSSNFGLNVSTGGIAVIAGAVIFGACTNDHIDCASQGTVLVSANYTIDGSPGSYHLFASYLSYVDISARTITLTGTPNWPSAFVGVTGGAVFKANSNTYTGLATGARYSATLNAVINTIGGGANYFPGNSAGSTATGGQYA